MCVYYNKFYGIVINRFIESTQITSDINTSKITPYAV